MATNTPPAERTPAETCNHGYTRNGTHQFVCVLPPHPTRPDQHYFEKAAPLAPVVELRGSRLVTRPGYRND